MALIHHSDVFKWLEKKAPLSLAYDWDPVGLQVGSYKESVKNILVTLDVTEAVVDEAIEKEANLIISHHPLLFKPLQSINTNTAKAKIIQKLLTHDITVYSSHTNLDIAEGGVNDQLANLIKLQNTKPFIPVKTDSLYKIAVFVPKSHVEEVRNALSKGGAGHIGNYSHCTFQSQGEGTFKPLEGTNPYIGKKGRIEYVDEFKVESIVPKSKLSSAIEAMIGAHPYEEVAYDIYPLENKGETYGLGRIGTMAESLSFKHFIEHVKESFKVSHLKISGPQDITVRKIAVVGGSGEKYISQAKKNGVDVYITGDVSFHQAQLAEEIGLTLIDAGHYIEQRAMELIKGKIEEHFAKDHIHVFASSINTDPFQIM